jgi:hypothetical protein
MASGICSESEGVYTLSVPARPRKQAGGAVGAREPWGQIPVRVDLGYAWFAAKGVFVPASRAAVVVESCC